MRNNTHKLKEMLIYFGKDKDAVTPLIIDGERIERVTSIKLLGAILALTYLGDIMFPSS
jgi:hypothetical protein